jgi:crotonobetainyl-CoA:carnitine CoA-transferase CaiB-like acyl-CoA transferase
MTLLSNLKILDFSTLLPGPFATLLLTDLGAEVLHVKKPESREAWFDDRYLNRSKKSITLDLKQDESKDLVKQLVKEYDIVLEQFRPGVMERLGLGYDDLKKLNPRLIYCSLTGFGQTGPYKDRPGHDINYLSIAGLSSYSGTQLGGPPNQGTQIADIAGGSLHSVIAILSAVIYRERTGEGQFIDISMTDCSFALNALFAPTYLVGEENLEPEKLMLNGGTFYGYYQTKDGRYFSVGSLEPQFRKALCEAIGRVDLIETSLSNNPEHIASFKETVKQEFLLKTFEEWQEIFADFEACAEPVLTFAEACEHPQLIARGIVVEVPKVDGGTQKQIACPIKTSVFTPNYKHVGLSPGDSNKEVFEGLNKLESSS